MNVSQVHIGVIGRHVPNSFHCEDKEFRQIAHHLEVRTREESESCTKRTIDPIRHTGYHRQRRKWNLRRRRIPHERIHATHYKQRSITYFKLQGSTQLKEKGRRGGQVTQPRVKQLRLLQGVHLPQGIRFIHVKSHRIG